MAVHVLTDVERGIWIDDFAVDSHGLSVRKRTLRGGLSDGVDIIEVGNGGLSFSVLPTRGMSLWRGECAGISLGWRAPIVGPVHPKFVNASERGGLGWLTGFDEWLCRCGLNWNGPPGDDNGRPLTLHGRIANSPAHFVEVHCDDRRIAVVGEVEEAGLFHARLRLRTTISTESGSAAVQIRDEVTILGATPAEMQLLYHLNQGAPLLGAGSQVHVAYRELWPMTAHAAQGLDDWTTYRPPTAGFMEQVYCMYPAADSQGRGLAVLHDAAGSRAMAVRWSVEQLPCFTVWKNTAAMKDGYVTGLEPATNFPRFKAQERAAGRVVDLAPGQTWTAQWSIEVANTAAAVATLVQEVEKTQKNINATIHREPLM